jgi:dTDP-4-dehydrorhamnose reductase
MRILIIGASSFIGFRFFQYFKENNLYEVVGTYFQNKKDDAFLKCDITNIEDVENTLNITRPDVILWVAGSKNLKKCEESFEYAKRVNTIPVQSCVKLIEAYEKKPHLIFFSTDYIFDGCKGNFTDLDIPNPRTNYGLSNYLAEKTIFNSSINYSIIRTSAVMGKGGTFFDWLLSSLKKEENLEMFNDIYFTPTPVNFLIENIANIIDQHLFGTFNISGSQRLSRFEFASIVKTLSNEFKANIVSCVGANKMQSFQSDLSLKQSLVAVNKKTFLKYLMEEVSSD